MIETTESEMRMIAERECETDEDCDPCYICKDVSEYIYQKAIRHEHSRLWSEWRWNDSRFRTKAPKCNQFVADIIIEAELPYPYVPIRPGFPQYGFRPPTASEWADPNINIPGFSRPIIVHPDLRKPGDISSTGSHMGIHVGEGEWINASSITNSVNISEDQGGFVRRAVKRCQPIENSCSNKSQ
jgi:hypothetical protein